MCVGGVSGWLGGVCVVGWVVCVLVTGWCPYVCACIDGRGQYVTFQQSGYPLIDCGREVSIHRQDVCINPLVLVDVCDV